MSKTEKERTRPTRSGSVQEDVTLIPLKYQHAAAVAVLFLSLVIFFNQIIFGGKTFLSVDTIASHSWDTVLKEASSEGVFPLWNPYIFCGMPGYASLTFGGSRLFDITGTIVNSATAYLSYAFLAPPEGWVLVYYLVFAIGMYLLVFSKVQSKLAALIGALAATYAMYIIIWVMSGHNTKISVMAFFPFLFLIIERLREKFDWKLGVVLVFIIHFLFLPAHVQMIFYTYLAIGIYFLFFLIRAVLTKGDLKGLVRAAGVFGIATLLAFCMDADKYLSVWEYNPYSMRGSNPIVQPLGAEKTVEGGLGYEYATAWSFGVGEVMTFFVPSCYGFGQTTYNGPLTNNQPRRLPLYFGPQNWTDGPQYMGVVVLILAFIGFVRNRKEPFVQYLAFMIVFSLLVAFGKEFSVLYDLMYKYFPMFNKFRIPSMILVLVQIFIPVLAAYGVASFVQGRTQNIPPASDRRWKYALAVLGVLFLVGLLAPGLYKGVYSSFIPMQEAARRLAPMVNNNQQAFTLLYDFIADKVVTDILFAVGFLLVTFGAIYRYLHQRLSLQILGIILVVVVVADLWRVDVQPMDARDRTEKSEIFVAPDYVRYLQHDTTLYRTILFENGQPPYNNTLAYWKIQSAYGYQGAKMRWYQDIDDVAGVGNPLVWQLMNVKYIISNRPDSSQVLGLVYNGPEYKVYANRTFVPRAFFVNRYEVAAGIDILRKMQSVSFNVRDVAFFTENPNLAIDPPKDGAGAEYVRYGMQDLGIKVTATGNNLLFLSEAYYPNGWKAFLDGKEIPIYRMNYFFRGVVVPAGSHDLEMKFEPKSFYLGKTLSLGTNIILIGVLIFAGIDTWRKKRASGITQDSRGNG
jgi:hypothetical protein